MKSNIRYTKPSGTSRRAGKLLSSRKPRMYKGFEIRGSSAGFHHVYFGKVAIANGLRSLEDARNAIDKLVRKVPNIGDM